MNIHPILVHFPIALLTIYSLMELAQFRFIKSTPYWFYVKASFVILGAGAAVLAYMAGDTAEKLIRARGDQALNQLVKTHSDWAAATLVIFGILGALYAFAWLTRTEIFKRFESRSRLNSVRPYALLKRLANYLVSSPVMIFPAMIGLSCVLVTGALGGAIVYGADSDPLIKVIYGLVHGYLQ